MRYLLFLLILTSCGPLPETCYKNHWQDITFYEVAPNLQTPNGFQIDTFIPLTADFIKVLDERLLSMEECMLSINPDIGPIKRDCFVVKLIKQTYFSQCSPNEEFLNVEAPQELCDAKGLEENPECKCMWRTAVQNNSHLIVPYTDIPEDLNLWDTVRIHSGHNNFWITEYAKCGNL